MGDSKSVSGTPPGGKEAEGEECDPGNADAMDFLITAVVQAASHLLDQLFSDEDFYEQAVHAWVRPSDAKKLFFYGVAREVLKTSVSLVTEHGLAKDGGAQGPVDRLSKIVDEAIADGQAMRLRKMTELLSLVILFERHATADEAYRVYRSAESLDGALGEQQDFREMHAGRSILNTHSSIERFAERLLGDLKTLGLNEIWFLDAAKLRELGKRPERVKPSVMATKKSVYVGALRVATDIERVALGVSYGRGYSGPSRAVHPHIGSRRPERALSPIASIRQMALRVAVSGIHIIRLAYSATGVSSLPFFQRVVDSMNAGEYAARGLAKMRQAFHAGDVVLTVWLDLAQIVEEHVNEFGDRAYKIKYVSRPPLPDVPEDWMEGMTVLIRLTGPATVREFYETILNRVRVKEEWGNVPIAVEN